MAVGAELSVVILWRFWISTLPDSFFPSPPPKKKTKSFPGGPMRAWLFCFGGHARRLPGFERRPGRILGPVRLSRSFGVALGKKRKSWAVFERALRNRAPGRRRQTAPSFGWAARHAAKRRQNGALGLARGAAHRGGLFENVGSYGGNRFVGLLGPPIGAAFACGRSRSRRSTLFRLKRRCSRLPPLCGSASQPGRCFCRSARKPKGLGWQRILGVAGSLCFDAAS